MNKNIFFTTYKNILKSFLGLFLVLVFAGQVNAAASLSIRLEQPKSPTNQDNFNLIFVTLDIQGRPITVRCFKKGPSDSGFSQFGGDMAISDGGNTGNCPVSSSIMNTGGTYLFYATTTAGSDTSTSTTDSVDFNTSGPGTPTDFSKSKNNPCEYKISYKTADDAGKTVKVELYRSDNQTFSADSGTIVDSHSIGSNTTDSFINGVPDCSKNYYYVLRAFDTYGNGSGLVGDSSVTVTTGSTTTTTTTTSGAGGAIPLGQGQGQVLGEKTQESVSPSPSLSSSPSPSPKQEGQGEVKGESIKQKTLLEKIFTSKIFWGIVILAVLGAAFYSFKLYKKSKKS